MENRQMHFMKKVLPAPDYMGIEDTLQGMLGAECKVSSREELAHTIDKMKTYEEAYRFDNYEPSLTAAEEALSQRMNANRVAVNAVVRDDLQARHYPPANPFYDVRRDLEDESKGDTPEHKLLELFRDMPKGGNLHIHTSATYNMDHFLSDLLLHYKDQIYVLDHDYKGKAGTFLKGTLFRFEKEGLQKDIPAGFRPLEEICISKEQKRKLVQLYTFADNSDYYIDHIGYIWGGFNQIFQRVHMILSVPKIFKLYYTNAFRLLIKDKIDYCELRCG
ncbi:MAG: hypothetical protein K6G04_02405, partial [Lachnospiraceae bacterium]|nr:hypothetical protein [Lachnospiraceae bacterium]